MADDARQRGTAARGLGRGLSALLGDGEPEARDNPEASSRSRNLPVAFLRPNPLQPRRNFDEGELKSLATSIADKGILQPILVRPTATRDVYEIIAGERRWRAAQIAKLHEVPVIVRAFSDAQSLEIAIIASALGILLSLPIGLLAARNLLPAWLTWPTRLFIALCRSFHQVIIAIVFVKAVGFGALAGILALTVASIGFVAKLFAEAIEEISLRQVEAIRATGASFMGVVVCAVMPQVLTRFVGFSTYQVDSNLRNSTMVGIVGAGGIGGTMFAAFQKFDYDYLLTILLAIIGMIMISEALQNAIKKLYR